MVVIGKGFEAAPGFFQNFLREIAASRDRETPISSPAVKTWLSVGEPAAGNSRVGFAQNRIGQV
jgi:hypothetical protein